MVSVKKMKLEYIHDTSNSICSSKFSIHICYEDIRHKSILLIFLVNDAQIIKFSASERFAVIVDKSILHYFIAFKSTTFPAKKQP